MICRKTFDNTKGSQKKVLWSEDPPILMYFESLNMNLTSK